MKKTLLLLCYIFILSFSSCNNQDEKSRCENRVLYGNTEICLPKITGKTECYSLPIINEFVSHIIGDNGMIFMGFYLPNEIHKEIHNIEEIPIEGVFIVYGQENMKNITGDAKQLNKVVGIMEDYFAELDSDLDDIFNIENELIKFGKPVLLESYYPNKDVASLVLLLHMKNDKEDYVNISIMNLMILKKKLITLNYYGRYNGNATIEESKAMNDYIVMRFQDENN